MEILALGSTLWHPKSTIVCQIHVKLTLTHQNFVKTLKQQIGSPSGLWIIKT